VLKKNIILKLKNSILFWNESFHNLVLNFWIGLGWLFLWVAGGCMVGQMANGGVREITWLCQLAPGIPK